VLSVGLNGVDEISGLGVELRLPFCRALLAKPNLDILREESSLSTDRLRAAEGSDSLLSANGLNDPV
jgi:hypothetical protein